MSGGSYDYIYSKIEDIQIRRQDENPRRRAFQKLLKNVANAMHDIEWVDSGDSSPGDEDEAIDACFKILKDDPIVIAKAEAFDRVTELANGFTPHAK